MTPGPRSARRPGSTISRIPVFALAVAFPRGLDATAVTSGGSSGHELLVLSAIPADAALLAGIACAIVLGFAALAVARRRRRFEGGAAGDSATSTIWTTGAAGQGAPGSRDPLVSLMTRPDAAAAGVHVRVARTARRDEQAAWVRRLDRPGRRNEDRG